jgi:hypothetical protein
MVPAARWLVVALLALGVCAAPIAPRLWPAHDTDISASALVRRITAAADTGWVGEVETQGSLSLPVRGDMFGGLARLLGDRTDLRVWWRNERRWRIDRITPTGETDVLRLGGSSIRWLYENSTARLVAWSPVRLPDDNDVVPSELARRMLAGATASELSRIPPRRVAGHSATGLRLVPSSPMTTISQVDVWADNTSGVPLLVEVYGGRNRRPVLTSQVTRFDRHDPADRQVSFEFAPDVDFQYGTSFDAVASANAFAPFRLPTHLVDLDRHGAESGLGAVGVYGRGPTALIAVPMRDEVAHELYHQLARSRSAREAGTSVSLEVGPLSVLLVRSERGNFLLTGTLTREAIRQAAIELQLGARRTR